MRLLRRTRTLSNDPRQVRRILIADDDPAIANLVRMALDDPRYEVVAVGTGLEAIQQFRKAAFDLVILDVMMPYVDGFEACQRIRETSDVPIVILTSRGGVDDVVHGFEIGADDYIPKPFKIVELQARVEAILRRVEGQHERLAAAGDQHRRSAHRQATPCHHAQRQTDHADADGVRVAVFPGGERRAGLRPRNAVPRSLGL